MCGSNFYETDVSNQRIQKLYIITQKALISNLTYTQYKSKQKVPQF